MSQNINFPPSILGFGFQSAIKTFLIFLINSSVLSDARQTKLLLYLNHVLKGAYFSTGNNSDNSERKIFWQSITGRQPFAVMLLHLQFMKLLSSIYCFYRWTPDSFWVQICFSDQVFCPRPRQWEQHILHQCPPACPVHFSAATVAWNICKYVSRTISRSHIHMEGIRPCLLHPPHGAELTLMCF